MKNKTIVIRAKRINLNTVKKLEALGYTVIMVVQ